MVPVGSGSGGQEQVVRAGNAIRCDRAARQVMVAKLDERRFTRAHAIMRDAARLAHRYAYANLVLSLKPAVYYRMEEWPKDEKNGCYVLVDSAPGGHHGRLYTFGDRGFQSRCRGKLGKGPPYLRGPMVGDYAVVPEYPKADNGQLSVSVWVWVDVFRIPVSLSLPTSGHTGIFRSVLSGGYDDFRLVAVVKQQNDKVYSRTRTRRKCNDSRPMAACAFVANLTLH